MFKRIVLVVVTLLLSSSNALAIHQPQNFMLFPNNIVGGIGNIGPTHYGILQPFLHIQNMPSVGSRRIQMQINRAIIGHGSGFGGLGGPIGGFGIGYPNLNLIIGGNWAGTPLLGNPLYIGLRTSILRHRLGIGF